MHTDAQLQWSNILWAFVEPVHLFAHISPENKGADPMPGPALLLQRYISVESVFCSSLRRRTNIALFDGKCPMPRVGYPAGVQGKSTLLPVA